MQGKDCLKYLFIGEYLAGSTLAPQLLSFPEVGMDTVPEALPAWLAAEVPVAQGRKEVFDRETEREIRQQTFRAKQYVR